MDLKPVVPRGAVLRGGRPAGAHGPRDGRLERQAGASGEGPSKPGAGPGFVSQVVCSDRRVLKVESGTDFLARPFAE